MRNRVMTILAAVALSAVSQLKADDGKKAYDITIPAVPVREVAIPEVPPVRIRYETMAERNATKRTVQRSAAQASSKGLDRSISFSKRYPPDWSKDETVDTVTEKEVGPGDVTAGKVSLYLRAPLMETDAVKGALEKAGFEVLAVFPVDKKK